MINAHENIARKQAAQQTAQQRFDALKKVDPDLQLFEEIGAPRIEQTVEHGPVEVFDMRCTQCKTTTITKPDLIDADSFPSYGGTTEGYERCTACGVSSSWADLSAVI